MKGFLDYVSGDSILHRLNPLTKIILSLFMCVSCFISESHLFVIGIILISLVIGCIGGVFDRALLLLRGLVKISILLFLVQVFFVRTGDKLLVFPLNVYITDEGLLFSSLIVLRLIGATLPLALMLSVTQMNDLSNVLVSKLFIPYKYAFALTTAIRFIPVFSNEMAEIMEAQTSRGVKFDTKNLFKKIRLILPLCVPLLISSVKKIEANAISARLRGFHCRNKNSGYKQYKMKLSDWSVMAFSIFLIFLALYF